MGLMWISYVFPLLIAIGGGGNDLLDYVQTEAYWRIKGVAPTVDRLAAELTPPQGVDLSQLIPQLGAEDAKARRAATAKIRALGSAAVPQLEEASRHSDPEISLRAKELLAQLKGGGQDTTVRRLLAIRTLGELGQAEALPALRELLNSKDLFVADYAASAVARIEGRQGAKSAPPLVRAGVKADARLGDVWLLGAKHEAVGQLAFSGHPIPSLDQLLEPFPDALIDMAMTGLALDVPHAENLTSRQKLLTYVTTEVLKVAEKTGNLRVDCVTFGVYANAPDAPGHTIVLVQGLYDPQAVEAAIKSLAQDAGENHAEFKTVAGVSVVQSNAGDKAALALVSERRAALVVAEREGELPLEPVIEACKTGHAQDSLKDNAEMAALVKSADKAADLWAVARVTPGLRQEAEALDVFDAVRLAVKRQDAKPGQAGDAQKFAYPTLTVRFEGEGANAAKVKSVAEEAGKGLKEGIESMKEMVGQAPPPMADLVKGAVQSMESVRIKAEGKKLVTTASLQGPTSMMMLPMLVGLPMRARAVQAPAPAAEDKAEAVKPQEKQTPAEPPVEKK